MKRIWAALTCVVVLSGAGFVVAQAPAPADPLSAGIEGRPRCARGEAARRRAEGPQTLFERPNGRIASTRPSSTVARGADIHAADDEIFLVLSGSARSTLGGEIADKKATGRTSTGNGDPRGITRTVGAGTSSARPGHAAPDGRSDGTFSTSSSRFWLDRLVGHRRE